MPPAMGLVQRSDSTGIRSVGRHRHEVDITRMQTKVTQDRRAHQVQPFHKPGGRAVDQVQVITNDGPHKIVNRHGPAVCHNPSHG